MRTSIVLFFYFLLCGVTFAQSNAGFQSLLYPRSIPAAGMGEQGAAATNALSAMQYNPANLIYSDRLSISYFNNPWNLLGFPIPLRSGTATATVDGIGSFGLDYTYWNFGEFAYTTAEGPGESNAVIYHAYERSIAVGYAASISNQLSIGAQVRYVWEPINPDDQMNHILFSAGISSSPDIFSKRISFGFSLMNLGTTIDIPVKNYPDELLAPPAQLNLGVETLPVKNNFFDINCSFGIMKPLVKLDNNGNASSSFNALLTEWQDFPEDITTQLGLGYVWHPIDIGGGISFIQEVYLGYYTMGTKESGSVPGGFFTHGVDVGIQYQNIKATVGYAGIWHNDNLARAYITYDLPWETFQFTLSTNLQWNKQNDGLQAPSPLKGILLSAGYTYGDPFGKMNEYTVEHSTFKFSSTSFFSIESDFYLNNNSAIISAFQYGRMKQQADIYFNYPTSSFHLPIELTLETVSIESGYRYHPFEQFHPFFIQGSLGIIRMNPTDNTTPKYFYQTFDEISIGGVIPVTQSGLTIIPSLGLKTIWMSDYNPSEHLTDYNQFTFGVHIGYKL